ncbi:SusC/RagA family TonB-linked outer membrane protein [Riemerella columbina]|uniref:SusC/RagA family TonB-linked outer membrane protein n=1 Tax=Riemerella columbina TaxID=103810 RepID=UPI00266F960E|nr:SusC/RagA family TonB-linked outer membrane protein [Riemerella columbina]WKS94914.1 SusC/RagA family TonB-linked outer membrane protein [Riemerella columbina]
MKKQVFALSALGFCLGLSNLAYAQTKDSLKTKKLDEVVIVAFGKQKAKAIVGSVASLGKEVLSTQQTSNVATAIQGSVAGVNIIGSGTPGAAPTIRIRGIGSINASSDPLIIVDGAQYSGSLSNISQEEIESLNVLKDGSATSLYGSRAANGVILITTKKGRKGKPRITLQSSLGYSAPVNDLYPLVDNHNYLQYTWEALRNGFLDSGDSRVDAGVKASQGVISRLQYNPYNVANPIDSEGNLVSGAQLLWNTDWGKELLNRSAERQETTATISGGTDQSNYFLSVNYLRQEGAIKTTEFERFTTRLNLESKLKPWLTVGLNTSYTSRDRNLPVQSGSEYGAPMASIYVISSVYPLYTRDENGNLVYDENGNLAYDFGAGSGRRVNAQRPFVRNANPVGSLYANKYRFKTSTLSLNGFAKIDFTNELSFRSNYAYEINETNNKSYKSNLYGEYTANGGQISYGRDVYLTKNFVNALNYNKKIEGHNIAIDAIAESYENNIDLMGAIGSGLFTGIEVLGGASKSERTSGYIVSQRLVGFLGRLSYNYKEKYFLEGSFRRDGSSIFSKDTRWGNFYSVGGAYILSEENFLKGNKTLSYLKLKSSYGELGNNNFGDNDYFPYLATYLTGFSVGSNTGIVLSDPKDALLTWEKTASFNAGIELGLFQNRVNINVDYYNKSSVDLIGPLITASSTGATSITSNIGKLRNYGWEFAINTKNIKNSNVTWNTSLNFSFDRNKIVELSKTNTPQVQGSKRWEVGRSLYDFYIEEYAGVNPDNGNPLWYKDEVDANGNTVKVTTEDYSQASRYYNHSSLPWVIGGLNNYIRFKNFDLNTLVNFSFGSYLYDFEYADLMDGTFEGRSSSIDLEQRWQKPGDVTSVPRFSSLNLQGSNRSTRFLFKNDYVRLKALTLGYNFDKEAVGRIGLRNLRLFLQADNMFTWQTHKYTDPEQSLSGLTAGRASNIKTVSFGVKVEF